MRGRQSEKLHANIGLRALMTFPKVPEASAGAEPELRNVGTMRIMGGISARRAVHRSPVADV